MTHQEFMGKASSRQRYWGRSMFGYKRFASRSPNVGHETIADLELRGFVDGVVTQNVDGLHLTAGSKNIVELHGRGHVVKCMSCGVARSRGEYKEEMMALNQRWIADVKSHEGRQFRPDADADLEVDFSPVSIIPCRSCDGVIKPDVVFFGDSIPAERRAAAFDMVNNTNGLIVIGSSVQVFSAFSLVLAAAKSNIPIAVLNIGQTRADSYKLETLRLSERCDLVLPRTRDILAS